MAKTERRVGTAARRAGMSRAAWIRSACYSEAILSGDVKAIQLLGGRLKGRLVETMRRHGLLRGGQGPQGNRSARPGRLLRAARTHERRATARTHDRSRRPGRRRPATD